MKLIYLKFAILLSLLACSSAKTNFNAMSAAEIADFNRTVSTWDQVICREQAHVSSRIPRRRCDTRINWQHGVVNDVNGLGTAVSGQQQIGVD
ncbi:MAG: hypothetical protein O2971_13060 [Proteobacteria bacterium]|nr:hypothetical protein [Pseudomonadota bacterium]